ncbi:MAG TPA: glycosyltransferase, partial [Tepidisphaeraceae bacterium]|nr:glycosyltransferase [Tepidisphaeraceae bacterium]
STRVHQIRAAAVRGDSDLLSRLLASADSATLGAAGDVAMSERRWTDAAWLFDRMPERDNTAGIKHCLSRNLAALQRHRRAIYDELISLPKSDHCGIGASASNHPTIVCRRADGQNISLSPNNLPLAGLAGAMESLKPAFAVGHSLALCGVGDGYLLHQLAQKPPKLFMDTQQSVFLLEPDAHVLLTALMIHDYTGKQGPIEQERFLWFVGSDWIHPLRTTLLGDPYLASPQISLMLGLQFQSIQSSLQVILREVEARDVHARTSVERYYATKGASDFSAVFSTDPPRRPRVMLLTTRFSTVLQYATRDAAAGFEQGGWETRVVIEPTPHHRVLTTGIRAAVAEFKPDLVFQIDHQRQEHAEMFPSNLPFVCWIQDHMPHLMKPEAGAKIGPADFVLTDAGATYVRSAGYPKRQMIALAKLTTPPPLMPRATVTAPAEDIVFISNATKTPAAMLTELLTQFPGDSRSAAFVTECVRRITDLYAAGDSLSTFPDISRFIRELLAEMDLTLDPEPLHQLIRAITHPLCDALYRHQTIRWTIAAARDSGLTLGLYGNGWDAHEDFALYARGAVASGEDFRSLTRRAAINLQIAPYLCLHQRMLDGICSGAFFLVRHHVADTAPQALLDLLETNCGPEVNGVEEAQARISDSTRARFETLVGETRRALCPMGTEDPIEVIRVWQEARLLEPRGGVLPHLDAISFSDAVSLGTRLERFARDPDLREEITADQRRSILARFTYAAAIRRITHRMGQLLGEERSKTSPGLRAPLGIGYAA